MATSPIFTGSTGDGKRDVPLFGPLAIAAFVIALLTLGYMQYIHKEQVASGSLSNVRVIERAAQDNGKAVLVSFDVHLKNETDKPQTFYSSEAILDAGGQQYKDIPGGISDVPRYFQAYPDLKSDQKVLTPDSKIPAHGELAGVVVVSFPVDKQTFDHRSGLKLRVDFRNEPSVEIK